MSERIAKAAILAACIEEQERLIDNYNQRLEEVQTDAYTHQDSPSQDEETSTTKLDLITTLEEQLGFVKLEMSILDAIDADDQLDVVGRGAVVVTDKRTFFIGVSSEEVDVDGRKIFGMSEKAPLYALMKGLRKGGEFAFKNTTYKILDLY
jgi:hypothetical protein